MDNLLQENNRLLKMILTRLIEIETDAACIHSLLTQIATNGDQAKISTLKSNKDKLKSAVISMYLAVESEINNESLQEVLNKVNTP